MRDVRRSILVPLVALAGAALPGRAARGDPLPGEIREGICPPEIRPLVPEWLWERETFLAGLQPRGRRRHWERYLAGETDSWIQNGRRVTRRVSPGDRGGVLHDLIQVAASSAARETPPGAREDVLPLLRALRDDEDSRIASSALKALSSLRDDALLPDLLRELSGGATRVRRAPVYLDSATEMALALGDPASVVAALVERLGRPGDPRGYVHEMRLAAGVFERCGAESAAPVLLRAVEDPFFRLEAMQGEDPRDAQWREGYGEAIRYWAARALRTVACEGRLPPGLLADVRSLLGAPCAGARLCAVRLLADADPGSLPPADVAAEGLDPAAGGDLVRLLCSALREESGTEAGATFPAMAGARDPFAAVLAVDLWVRDGADPGEETVRRMVEAFPPGPPLPPVASTREDPRAVASAWAAGSVALLALRYEAADRLPASLAGAIDASWGAFQGHFGLPLCGVCHAFLQGEVSPAPAPGTLTDLDIHEFEVVVDPALLAEPHLLVCAERPDRLRALLEASLDRLGDGPTATDRRGEVRPGGVHAWWHVLAGRSRSSSDPVAAPLAALLTDGAVMEMLAARATCPPSGCARAVLAEHLLQTGWSLLERDLPAPALSPQR